MRWLSRKFVGVFLSLVMLVGGAVIATGAEPAGATFVGPYTAPIANSGSCYFTIWFNQADIYQNIVAYQVSSTSGQPNGCVYEFQFKVKCGVYGVPGTYYWYVGTYYLGWISTGNTIPSGYPLSVETVRNPTDTCPVWGNDIILDIEIVIKAYPTGNTFAWSINNQQWMALCLNGSNVHCNFEGNQQTYWA